MATDRPNCVLYVASDSEHLKQLYTGFAMLAKHRRLRLKQQFVHRETRSQPGAQSGGAWSPSTLLADVDGTRLCYHTSDAATIDSRLLTSVDRYFKRSFDSAYIRSHVPHEEQAKILPLGLNYPVESPGFDRFRLERARLHGRSARIRTALKGMAIDRVVPGLSASDRLTSIEGHPSVDARPRVLFVPRLWNPDAVPDQTQRDFVRHINETRVLCVKTLREAFGPTFSGGLVREPYAERWFPDCLLPAGLAVGKLAYLRLLPEHPICVSTTGLHRSIPWKLGEYVAFSRAIVTEKLHYQVPGDFAAGTNYLEFETPAELLAAVKSLIDDRQKRVQMMQRNREYYVRYVRPDSLVLNSLVAAGINLLPPGNEQQ